MFEPFFAHLKWWDWHFAIVVVVVPNHSQWSIGRNYFALTAPHISHVVDNSKGFAPCGCQAYNGYTTPVRATTLFSVSFLENFLEISLSNQQ